jgi:hypothetical protein
MALTGRQRSQYHLAQLVREAAMERVEQGTFSRGCSKMSATPNFLEGQLRLYGEQAETAESWKIPHEEAMFCWSIEDTLDLGLSILASIRRHNQKWANAIEQGRFTFTWEMSNEFARQYGWWKTQSALVLRAIETCEAHGYSIGRADEFRHAYRDVCLLPLDTNRTRESVESLESGRGKSHAAAMNGLRDRMGL